MVQRTRTVRHFRTAKSIILCVLVCFALKVVRFKRISGRPYIVSAIRLHRNPSRILAEESYPSTTRVVSSVPTSSTYVRIVIIA